MFVNDLRRIASYIIIAYIAMQPTRSFQQIIGTSAYLIGDFVEVGINAGGHEGAPLLATSNNRSNQPVTSPVYFGFVANPQMDGWTEYDGDFFTPGSPENGFGFQVAGVDYNNNASGLLQDIPGSITDYQVSGDCMSAFWEGNIGDLQINIVYRLMRTELFYTTEVTVTNTGGTDYTDIYYHRNLDPDNNVTLSFDYSTQNTIVAQPIPGCEKALVSATQTAPWDSYIGLGAIGANFRVTYGGFANRNAADIWNGLAGLEAGVGATTLSDQAISLAYRIEDLPAGEAETFAFTVVLGEAYVDEAVSSLYYFDYVDGGGVIDECVPSVDTARICDGESITLTVDGPNAGDYVWVWDPPTGLDTVGGPTVIANPATTTEYTVTGTPAPICITSTIEKSIVVQVVPMPDFEIVDPGPLCTDSYDLTTLAINDFIGTDNALTEFYSIVPDSMGQIAGIWPSDLALPGDTVFVLYGDSLAGCFGVLPFVPDFGASSNAGPDNDDHFCASDPDGLDLTTLLTGADTGGTWTDLDATGGLDPLTGMFDGFGLVPGDYEFEYIVETGGCPGDTALITVVLDPSPIIEAGPDQEICAGDITTVNGAGGEYYFWDSGAFDGLPMIPSETGVYTVTGFDDNGCTGTDNLTITVNPLPTVNAGADVEVCEGEEITLSASGAATYAWDGGVVDGVSFLPPVGISFYAVVGTDASGCVNSDDLMVTVHNRPTVTTGDDFVICEGTAITLVGAGAETLTWSGGVVDGDAFIPTGTATYTLTGTDAFGCSGTDDITVTIEPNPTAAFTADVLSGCYPLTVNFSNISGPGIAYDWYVNGDWAGSSDGMAYTFNEAGCHDVTFQVMSANGCVGEATYLDYICLDEYPFASFYPDPPQVLSHSATTDMVNTSTGATTYSWDFGDGTSGVPDANPSHTYPDEIRNYDVTLIAYSEMGCPDTAVAVVEVIGDLIFYIPNVFTPDNDNFNETFQPVFYSGIDIYDYHLLIFNRWGEIIFESYNPAVGWDGTYGSGDIVEDGTYVWRIDFGDLNNDKRHTRFGHVSLLK